MANSEVRNVPLLETRTNSQPLSQARRDPENRPQLIYAVIIREPNTFLVEHATLDGNFREATIQVLSRLDSSQDWKSYVYSEFAFHYIIDRETGLWFLCMADQKMARRLPFAFLEALRQAFKERYPIQALQRSGSHGMQAEYKGKIQEMMEQFNDPKRDKVKSMIDKVKDINENLIESLEGILERQEKIDLLIDRSEQLSIASNSFRREAVQVRRVMWWRNFKTWIYIVLVFALVLLLILFSSCGIDFSKC